MANRQTRRREEKKKKAKAVEEVKTSTNTIDKIIIALMVILVLGMFYLLTIYITNKHSEKNNTEDKTETTDSTFNYNKITVGKTFTMSDDDYIVVLYDTSNEDISNTYSNLISTYKAKEEHLPIYYVDMNDSINKKYTTTEESNKNPTKASELLVNGPTLIRITSNNLVDYLEGEEAINNYLN